MHDLSSYGLGIGGGLAAGGWSLSQATIRVLDETRVLSEGSAGEGPTFKLIYLVVGRIHSLPFDLLDCTSRLPPRFLTWFLTGLWYIVPHHNR